MIENLGRRVLRAAHPVALAALALLGAAPSAAAQEASKWAVVRVGDEVRVVESSGVDALRDSLDKDWKAAMQQHTEARKRAAKAKEKFSEPKPARPVFKVLKDGLKTQDLANAARDEWEARLSKGGKGGAASGGKEDGGGGKADFVAVRVGSENKVVQADRLKQLRQDITARDKRALADYETAKKAAKKAKQPFSDEKPKKTEVKVLKKFSSQEEAQAYLASLGSEPAKEPGKKDG